MFRAYSAEVIEDSRYKVSKTPYIYTIFKEGYGAERQNWDVSSNSKGVMYFANSEGLLSFDGERWQLYPTNNYLRTVYYLDGKIYVGGDGIMGYFLEDNLEAGLQELNKINENIWKIYPLGNDIIFQSFTKFYHLAPNGVVTRHPIIDGSTTFSYNIADEILFQRLYGDIIALNSEGEQRIVSSDPKLKNLMVKTIDSIGDSRYLIGTLDNGLFILAGGRLSPIHSELNSILKSYKINKCIRLSGDTFAFATMTGGVVIGDYNGNVATLLNRYNGLANNRIHSLHLDDNAQLWIGTDNGISYIDTKSPILFLSNSLIEFGSFYDVEYFNGEYYMGTNHGLFRTKRNNQSKNIYGIELIDGHQTHIANISDLDGKLWISGNNGTYIFDGKDYQRLSSTSGGYTILRSSKNSDLIFQSSYYSVSVYYKVGGEWQHLININEIKELTKDIVELNDGKIIVVGASGRLYEIEPHSSGSKFSVEAMALDTKSSDPASLRLFALRGDAIFAASDTTLLYHNGTLSPAPKELQGVEYISTEIDSSIFILRGGALELYNLDSDSLRLTNRVLNYIGDRLIFKNQNISELSSGEVAMCLSDRVAFTSIDDLFAATTLCYAPAITSYEFFNNMTGEGEVLAELNSIPYWANSVRFTFTAYNHRGDASYEYLLSGYNNEWQHVEQSHQEFQNLPEGRYTMMVRRAGQPQNVARLNFNIKPPFYRSWYAYLCYIILCVGGLYLARYIYTQRQRRAKLIELKKQRIRINRLRMKNSQKRLTSEVRRLKAEVTTSSDKLTNLMLQHTKEHDVLMQISEELQGLNSNPKDIAPSDIKKLLRIIRSNYNEKTDWVSFENSFNEIHSTFFEELKKRHPILTKEDLKFCAYLKIKLSSKELSTILNITPRSIDLRKYRLKKKLQLSRSQSLRDYIIDFDIPTKDEKI